ncbi:MAG: hypothetical protein E4H14_01160 [Candidatus Thorarchaeota archaeon]|nr:MAG: hypothetical protein E4H14_01160 [Candidatus Thorarchaeota archaeon]
MRGERLQQALDEETTYNQLRQNIQVGFPDTQKRQHATGEVNVGNIQFVPVANGLQINAQSRSNSHNYAQSMIFTGVETAPEGAPDTASYMGTDGETHNITPIALAGSRAKVNCSCLDFHYRFAKLNYSADALVGNPPPLYQRKTQTRPPANPARVPGICKHIIRLVDMLKQQGILR